MKKELILDIIRKNPGIGIYEIHKLLVARTSLWTAIAGPHRRSINTALVRLEKEGLVRSEFGKRTWQHVPNRMQDWNRPRLYWAT